MCATTKNNQLPKHTHFLGRYTGCVFLSENYVRNMFLKLKERP